MFCRLILLRIDDLHAVRVVVRELRIKCSLHNYVAASVVDAKCFDVDLRWRGDSINLTAADLLILIQEISSVRGTVSSSELYLLAKVFSTELEEPTDSVQI
jgi:hypothetical protein